MLKNVLAETLLPFARGWIRYAPVSTGKRWLWDRFSWRKKDFQCRTIFGSIMNGNTKDLIQSYLYYFGVWEPHTTRWIEKTLKEGDVFIDVGANIGYYSLLASKLVGSSGSVVAIEAAPWIHALAVAHLKLNGCTNVRAVSVAASAKRGRLRVYPGPEENLGNTTTVPRDGESVEVDALPLSDILTEREISAARIVKIDVEGAERDVMQGLIPILARLRPDAEILIEIAGPASEIFDAMRSHGYLAYSMRNDYTARDYLVKSANASPARLPDDVSAAEGDVLFSRAAY